MKTRPAFDTDKVFFLRKPDARAALPIPTLRGSDWAKEGVRAFRVNHHQPSRVEWWVECHLHGMQTLAGVVEIDPDVRGGLPVLVGTRFTIAQVLAELADTHGVDEVASEFDLDADAIRSLLNGMSLVMQRPISSK